MDLVRYVTARRPPSEKNLAGRGTARGPIQFTGLSMEGFLVQWSGCGEKSLFTSSR